MNAGEMIQYSTVEQMAETYREAVAAIRAAALTIGTQTERLKTAFADESSYTYGISLKFHSNEYECEERDRRGIDELLDQVKRDCWGKIIEKLNIRRLMSSKRVDELNSALQGKGARYGDPPPAWPDITPETIESVARGYLASANEFLEEAVAEEYDWWRPRRGSEYKTNANGFWKLQRKIISGAMVRRKWSGRGFDLTYYSDRSNHVAALDNIFHMLDGKGPTPSYKGELGSAIEMSEDGRGETPYFRFKCYGNGNLHLEFRRLDLLNLFNQIAAKRDRLGQEERRTA